VACFVETERHHTTVTAVRDRLPQLTRLWRIDAGHEATGGQPGDLAELRAGGGHVEAAEVEAGVARYADDLPRSSTPAAPPAVPRAACSPTEHVRRHRQRRPGLHNLFHEGATTLLFLPLAHCSPG
jgi:long-chain acyl-CoA synthetase